CRKVPVNPRQVLADQNHYARWGAFDKCQLRSFAHPLLRRSGPRHSGELAAVIPRSEIVIGHRVSAPLVLLGDAYTSIASEYDSTIHAKRIMIDVTATDKHELETPSHRSLDA